MADVRADAVAVYVYRRMPGVEFLQVRRSAATGEYQGSWQTVYGGVHAGETAMAAAVRELKEETGLVPVAMWQVEYLETFYFMVKDYVLLMPVFAVEVGREAAVVLNGKLMYVLAHIIEPPEPCQLKESKLVGAFTAAASPHMVPSGNNTLKRAVAFCK